MDAIISCDTMAYRSPNIEVLNPANPQSKGQPGYVKPMVYGAAAAAGAAVCYLLAGEAADAIGQHMINNYLANEGADLRQGDDILNTAFWMVDPHRMVWDVYFPEFARAAGTVVGAAVGLVGAMKYYGTRDRRAVRDCYRGGMTDPDDIAGATGLRPGKVKRVIRRMERRGMLGQQP